MFGPGWDGASGQLAYRQTRHSALGAAETALYTGGKVEAMPQSLVFGCNGEAAAQAATQALVQHGFHVVRSFDLHSALDAHADDGGPQCGSEQFAGEFVVLLVYRSPATGSACAPVVVTTYSRDGQAECQIVQDANYRPDEYLVACVWGTLREAAQRVQHLPEPAATAPAAAKQEIS
jgi:hypothetical protein